MRRTPSSLCMRRRFNVTDELHGEKFFVKQPDPKTGKLVSFMTPLFLALVMIEIADVIFAVDSVPAIFAITTDPFIVYTSNIFAILGLRALYFALAAMVHRFHYLKYCARRSCWSSSARRSSSPGAWVGRSSRHGGAWHHGRDPRQRHPLLAVADAQRCSKGECLSGQPTAGVSVQPAHPHRSSSIGLTISAWSAAQANLARRRKQSNIKARSTELSAAEKKLPSKRTKRTKTH